MHAGKVKYSEHMHVNDSVAWAADQNVVKSYTFSLSFCCSASVETILKDLASTLLDHSSRDKLHLTVRRRYALADGIDMLEIVPPADLFLPLAVSFIGEAAVDDGGPTREFASLLVQQCSTSPLMDGVHISHTVGTVCTKYTYLKTHAGIPYSGVRQ